MGARENKEAYMRTTYVLAIAAAAVVIVALGAKAIVFAPKAAATVSPSNTVTVDDLHRDYPNMKDLPILDIKDPI
jgi:hypothetical protein